MRRIWRNTAGQILVLYLILDVIAIAVAAISHPPVLAKDLPAWLAVTVFLAWRVSRGGRISRVALILLGMLSFEGAAFIGTRLWTPGALVLLAIYATQIALLVSPAIYQHTRRSATPDLVPAAPPRWSPPLWMPMLALVAGLGAALVSLGSQAWAAIPGCGPAGATLAQLPDRCIGLTEGYPVRFLTADQGAPLIGKVALLEDWAHWSVVSFAVLYILLVLHRRRRAPSRQPVMTEDGALA
jgi:hypothetical protein